MRIAVDIDEVLFEFTKGFLKIAEDKGYGKKEYGEVLTYNLWEVFGISKDEALKISEDFYNSINFERACVVVGAKEGVEKLKGRGYELFFLTNRPISWKEKTVSFLKNNFGVNEDSVFFAGDFHLENGKGKAEICHDLGVKIIIEDHNDYVIEYARQGIKVFLIDKPWNGGVKHENIVRCFGWGDVIGKLGRINDERG